jgi:hypothetical protein
MILKALRVDCAASARDKAASTSSREDASPVCSISACSCRPGEPGAPEPSSVLTATALVLVDIASSLACPLLFVRTNDRPKR